MDESVIKRCDETLESLCKVLPSDVVLSIHEVYYSEAIPTACYDKNSKTLTINPNFILSLSQGALCGLIKHECGHFRDDFFFNAERNPPRKYHILRNILEDILIHHSYGFDSHVLSLLNECYKNYAQGDNEGMDYIFRRYVYFRDKSEYPEVDPKLKRKIDNILQKAIDRKISQNNAVKKLYQLLFDDSNERESLIRVIHIPIDLDSNNPLTPRNDLSNAKRSVGFEKGRQILSILHMKRAKQSIVLRALSMDENLKEGDRELEGFSEIVKLPIFDQRLATIRGDWKDYNLTDEVEERKRNTSIICIRDESGSMSDGDIAVSLAVLDGCIQKNRLTKIYLIRFTSNVEEIKEFKTPEEAIPDFLMRKYSGGTCMSKAIEEAKKICENDDIGNVIIISDFCLDGRDKEESINILNELKSKEVDTILVNTHREFDGWDGFRKIDSSSL